MSSTKGYGRYAQKLNQKNMFNTDFWNNVDKAKDAADKYEEE